MGVNVTGLGIITNIKVEIKQYNSIIITKKNVSRGKSLPTKIF